MLVMESAMPPSARIVLFCLIGLLLVILGFLVAFAVLIRRRPQKAPAAQREPVREVAAEPRSEPTLARAMTASSGGAAVGGMEGAVAAFETVSSLSCPTCRREFDGKLVYCPNDARRLVPTSEMLDRTRSGGSVCPRCRRAFDPGVRFCPHDATELVPVSIYEATSGAKHPVAPTGVLAKICPQCRERYDLAATFCGKDGSELRTIN